MAKTKRHHASATSHRSTSGSQQHQRERYATTVPEKVKHQQRRRAARRRNPWPLVIGILVVIAGLVVLFIVLSNQSATKQQGATGTPVDTTTLQQVTQVSPSVLSQIGTGNITPPFAAPSGSPPLLTGPTGKPEVFYYGGEFCPYCAAQRWPVIIALSRFGTFHKLYETTSSSTDVYPDTATFTFYQSSYSSSLVDFVPVEGTDRQQNPLQTLTPDQQQLVSTYDTSNGIPFMDIGNKYLVLQPSYSPGLLRIDQNNPNSTPLTQSEIASQLTSGNALSKSILGSANYLTAAICVLTNNQPSTVCSDASIQHIETLLKQTAQVAPALHSSGTVLTFFATQPVAYIRRLY